MSGWVMWASKPGKWSKRWLELKEHSLLVCKSDKVTIPYHGIARLELNILDRARIRHSCAVYPTSTGTSSHMYSVHPKASCLLRNQPKAPGSLRKKRIALISFLVIERLGKSGCRKSCWPE